MNGISMTELYDKLYYGADIDFRFEDLYYHINAGTFPETGKHGISMYKTDKSPDSYEEPTFYNEICEYSADSKSENIEKFLNAPLFDGKSFYNIESKVIMIYC